MAISDSRRLPMVLAHLYPSLKFDKGDGGTSDYEVRDEGDGVQILVWKKEGVTEPTAQELANAKEDAVDAWWWKMLRKERDLRLVASDWSQGADVPSATKNAYVTYRTDLRDLPTTVNKPNFSTLNTQTDNTWFINIKASMPSSP